METTNTNNESKFDYKTLSLQGQYAWRLCKQILKDLKEGKCTDEQISSLVSSIDANKHGYIKPDDYLPAEKAMKVVRVHRNEFFTLTKQNNVQCRKINGHSIGYHKDDIQRLCYIVSERRKKQ